MTAAQVQQMSSDEFLKWDMYFRRRAQQAELARLKAGRR